MISLRAVVTGFGNRDPLAEVWHRDLRGGGGGSAVISGVPPLRYIGNGRPLTDYRIAGNAVQDGTPSADAPVDAAGCGVRTGNLAPPLSEWVDGYINSGTGTIHVPSDTSEKTSEFLGIPNNATIVSFSGEDGRFEEGSSGAWRTIGFYDRNYAFISRLGGNGTNAMIVTVPEGAAFMRACCRTYGSEKNYMLNLGSTALPYEPYGFKLPPTVNGVEYPIYLGQVETMRRIKKLVLTGEEDSWTDLDIYYTVNARNVRSWTPCRCSHCEYGGVIGGNSTTRLWVKKASFPNCTSLTDFKSYLAAQYAAGTPVTVWYVLATQETAIVNEPLMKIGDYADTISFAQAGVTIPTVSGENVLDVPTEVPPSQITIRGGISSV